MRYNTFATAVALPCVVELLNVKGGSFQAAAHFACGLACIFVRPVWGATAAAADCANRRQLRRLARAFGLGLGGGGVATFGFGGGGVATFGFGGGGVATFGFGGGGFASGFLGDGVAVVVVAGTCSKDQRGCDERRSSSNTRAS